MLLPCALAACAAPTLDSDLRPRSAAFGLPPRAHGHRPTCSIFTTVAAQEFATARATGTPTRLSVEYCNRAANAATGRGDDGDFFHCALVGFGTVPAAFVRNDLHDAFVVEAAPTPDGEPRLRRWPPRGYRAGMKPRVLVTRHVYPAAVAILQEHCIVDYQDTYDVMDEGRLRQRLQHADAVVCQLTDPLTAAVIAGVPKLRGIHQIAVGTDNVDVAAATARGIVVTNTPGVLTEATADLTWALLLAVARRLPAAEQFLRAGRWQRWDVDLLCGSDVHGRTLGVVGFGRIGQAVARRARGFGMRVLYNSRRAAAPEVERELGALRAPLDLLLRESDFVSLHVPLRPETKHLIGVEQLCAMKRSAFLINTARGPVVDEAALLAALEEGLIAGAGLDVFEHEPRVPPGLLALPNVVLLPHVGSAVTSVRSLMCALAANDCVAVLTGQRPKHAVNPQVLG